MPKSRRSRTKARARSTSRKDGRGHTRGSDSSAAFRRTTPPKRVAGFRPTWHKVVGALFIFFGVALIALNYAEDEKVGILPGGHSPLYFLAGILIAGSSMWWFGALDRV